MPTDIPSGYITRPTAAESYNRSQRALERDLDVAILTQDEEVLTHWKLITKDGTERSAKDVTIDLVKQLQSDGMVPTWCVAETFLEREYGRKGEPKPDKSGATTQAARHAAKEQTAPGSASPKQPDGREVPSQPGSSTMDMEFWKERIVRLEQQIADEKKRHDAIVEKLFSQLAVKDKQISAWDEVTQGLTKALATGQIMPMLTAGNPQQQSETRPRDEGVQDAGVVEDAQPSTATKAAPSSRPKGKRRTARKSTSTSNRSKKKPSTEKTKENKTKSPPKPKWYDTPTLNRVASRLLSRGR